MPRRKKEEAMETQASVPVPAADDVAEQLRKLGNELAQVADDVVARGAKLKEVEAFLGNLQVRDFPDLAESPVVQSFIKLMGGGDLKPGQTKNAGTLAQVERTWTWRDVDEQFDKLTIVPFENVPITWQGLRIYLTARVPNTIPRPFYDIYMEHLRAQTMAKVHEDYLSGMSDMPPDPMWTSEGGAVVRAWSLMGRPYGIRGQRWGSGLIDMRDQPANPEAVVEEKKGA